MCTKETYSTACIIVIKINNIDWHKDSYGDKKTLLPTESMKHGISNCNMQVETRSILLIYELYQFIIIF